MNPSETGVPPPALLQGIEEFNRREYFRCHETLEALWLGAAGEPRELYQGLIQVAVGLLHAERDNVDGALALLDRGMARLERLPTTCMGVDVAGLVGQVRTRRAALAEGSESRPVRITPPRIRHVPD